MGIFGTLSLYFPVLAEGKRLTGGSDPGMGLLAMPGLRGGLGHSSEIPHCGQCALTAEEALPSLPREQAPESEGSPRQSGSS